MTRRGLVLGGGGVLGAAWMVGAVTALEQVHGLDARDFDEYVGTSAGSVVASLLACGVSIADLRTHQLGGRVSEGPLAGLEWDHDTATGGERPPTPKVEFAVPGVLRKGFRHWRQLPPTAVISSFMPIGQGSIRQVGELVRHVVPSGWARRPGLTVVAFDIDSATRAAFGRPDAPQVDLAEAVMASCAIPSWYQPVVIEGRRYVDGGAWSATNVDLLQGCDLDEVYVLAPGVTFDPDTPTRVMTKLERRWRARSTARCLREMRAVHQGGTHVTVLGPSSTDLEVMGHNVMDVARRTEVLDTSLHTSLASLAAPHVLDIGTPELAHDEVTAYVGSDEPREGSA
jgi:NTE family protein